MFESQLAECLAKNYTTGLPYISPTQLSETILHEWNHHINTLYGLARSIANLQSTVDCDPNTLHSFENAVYKEYATVIQMIGKINEQLLRRNNSFSKFAAAIASIPANEDEIVLGNNWEIDFARNQSALFRMRLEWYLGRELVIQSLKSEQIILDEIAEQKLISRYSSKMSRKIKRQTEARASNTSNLSDIPTLDTQMNPDKEDTLLLSPEDFHHQLLYIDELEEKLAVYALLTQAMDDIKLGRVKSADEVFAELRAELEKLTE